MKKSYSRGISTLIIPANLTQANLNGTNFRSVRLFVEQGGRLVLFHQRGSKDLSYGVWTQIFDGKPPRPDDLLITPQTDLKAGKGVATLLTQRFRETNHAWIYPAIGALAGYPRLQPSLLPYGPKLGDKIHKKMKPNLSYVPYDLLKRGNLNQASVIAYVGVDHDFVSDLHDLKGHLHASYAKEIEYETKLTKKILDEAGVLIIPNKAKQEDFNDTELLNILEFVNSGGNILFYSNGKPTEINRHSLFEVFGVELVVAHFRAYYNKGVAHFTYGAGTVHYIEKIIDDKNDKEDSVGHLFRDIVFPSLTR